VEVIEREKELAKGEVLQLCESLGRSFPIANHVRLLRGLSVEDIVGVQAKARRAFGLETYTQIWIWARILGKGSYYCMFYSYWITCIVLWSKLHEFPFVCAFSGNFRCLPRNRLAGMKVPPSNASDFACIFLSSCMNCMAAMNYR